MKGEMMKGNKLFGCGFLLVVALLLGAIPASASAKALVQFEEEEAPAKLNALAYTVFEIDQPMGCRARAEGNVGTDPASKVAVTATKLGSEGYEKCRTGSGATESGYIEETQWESSGQVKVKGTISLTLPAKASGVCVFVFKKFPEEAKLTFPGFTGFKGKTTGKLNKAASNKEKGECEKKLTTNFIINVEDEEEEAFEMST
jgi:hypothetical protein